jgi:PBP1b-binding outer membrane lipoprotein LpoB
VRIALVLVAALSLAGCTGESTATKDTEPPNEQEIATCEMFRAMESEIGDSGLADLDPDQVEKLLGTVTEIHNTAESAENADLVRTAESMFEALAAWPLPPAIRDFPVSSAEMSTACSALGH